MQLFSIKSVPDKSLKAILSFWRVSAHFGAKKSAFTAQEIKSKIKYGGIKYAI